MTSLREDLRAVFNDVPEVEHISLIKDCELHGEPALEVIVEIREGPIVTGVFTTEQKESFGGVQFGHHKDIPTLMYKKVQSVLKGTAE
jgi:hypothetical protein